MSKREWKFVGLDKALEGMLPEERAHAAQEIEEILRDFESENPPGEPVARVDPGTRVCPRCGGPLVELALLAHPDNRSNRELILECDTCDATFSERVGWEPS